MSLDTARTSANLMRKVATAAKMARETASMKRRGMMEEGNLLCYKESVEEIDCIPR